MAARRPPSARAVEAREEVSVQVLERRICEHGVEAARAWQEIAQVQRVEAAHVTAYREQGVQQRGATGGELVQRERSAARLREDGDEAMTRRRLQHAVARTHLCGEDSERPEVWRRGELVEQDLLFAAPRVGQSEIGKVGQEGGDLGRRILQA